MRSCQGRSSSAIGGTPALLALDKQLSDLFDALLAKTAADQRPAVYDDERKWLRETRGPCARDETCLLRVYRVERLLHLAGEERVIRKR